MIIYLVRNLIDHKVYIGKTSKPLLKFRRCGHLKSSMKPKQYFHLALKKHGRQNFKWYILNSSAKTNDELSKLEIEYINLFKQRGYKLYNMTYGGDGRPSKPQKDSKLIEANRRIKISNTLKGREPWNKGIKTGSFKKDSNNERRTKTK